MPAWTGLPESIHQYQDAQTPVKSLGPSWPAWVYGLCGDHAHDCCSTCRILDHRLVLNVAVMDYFREPGFQPATIWRPPFKAPILSDPVTSFAVLRYLEANPGAKTTDQISCAMNACVPATGARLGYLFSQGLVGRQQLYNKLKRTNYFKYWALDHAKTQ